MAAYPPGAAAPQQPAREHAIDALRGFALLGILAVNVGSFSSSYFGTGVSDPAFSRPVDQATRWLVSLLFESKFYLMFSLLFGYSFALQMDSASRAGASFVPRFLRRLLGLGLIGAAHAWLLFVGDILVTYALLGLILLALRDMRPRATVALAVALIACMALAWGGIAWVVGRVPSELPLDFLHAQAQEAMQAYRESAASAIAQRGYDLTAGGVWFVLAFVQAPCALAMFLLGLAAHRSGYLVAVARQPARLCRWMAWCLPVGLAGAWFYASAQAGGGSRPEYMGLLALAVDMATAPFLTCGYVAALLWLLQRGPAGQALGAALAPAGRMALSNYLLQSLVGALVFTAYGFALIGRVPPWLVQAGALMLYAGQLMLSRHWMRAHAYGPVEWLLRAFTHWRWPVWRAVAGRA